MDELAATLTKENNELEKYLKEKQDLEKQYSKMTFLNVKKKAQLSKKIKECDEKIQQKKEIIDDLNEKINYLMDKTDEKLLVQIKEIKSILKNYFLAVQEIEKKFETDFEEKEPITEKEYNDRKEALQNRKNEITEKKEKAIAILRAAQETDSLLSKIASDSEVDENIKETAAKVEKIVSSKRTVKK